jgi:chromosome segregation ATPase/ribosomal protein L37AE/L43A
MNEAQTHFVASCPYCSAQLKIRREFVGQQVQCKHCKETFVAGAAAGPAAEAPGEGDAVRPLPPAPQTERVLVTCPNCQAALSIRRVYLGRQVRCKQCDGVFLASDSAAAVAPPPEARRDRNGDAAARAALEAELDRQRQEAGQLQEALARTTTELEAIRAHLGEIAPVAVRPLFEERASLIAEIDRLRDEVEALSDERSARDRSAGERERHDEEGLGAALAEVDRLTGLVKQGELDMEAARAERDRLGVDRQRALDEAAHLRASLVESEQATRDEGNRLRDEANQFRSDRDRLRSEVEELRQSLKDLERTHREELLRRDDQLQQAGEQARGREDLLAERDRLLDQIEDLRRSLDEAEQRRLEEIGLCDADRAAVEEQRRQHQERQEAAEQSAMELREQNQQLQAELDRFRSSLPTLASDDELQAARAEIESLNRKLDLADRLEREMAGILAGMGIRVRRL